MAGLALAVERLFDADGRLAKAVGDTLTPDEARQLRTEAQLRSTAPAQGPKGSRPRRTETRSRQEGI